MSYRNRNACGVPETEHTKLAAQNLLLIVTAHTGGVQVVAIVDYV